MTLKLHLKRIYILMSKTETEVDVEGVVEEAFANARFRVRLANGCTVMCTVAGKMRRDKNRFIRIVPCDKVLVGVSIYDMTKGRIKYRY